MAQDIKGIVRPPMRMPSELLGQRSKRTDKRDPKQDIPLLITLFAWFCFLRSGAYIVFAMIEGLKPDSHTAAFLSAHFDFVPPPIPPEAAFFVLALLYGMIGWRWFVRDWRARWSAMFMAGAAAARIAVERFADYAAGNPTPLTESQQQAAAVAVAFNLIVCCYLAFYPGMDQAFKETPWE
jgi:hypothetical protein